MKNKKILNIWLLTFSMISLITFILPIKKYSFLAKEILIIKILFYLFNAIALVALVAIIIMAIVNLFKDNYNLVGLMEGFALTAFILVFFVVLCFAVLSNAKIHAGYFITAIEIFVLANFSQIIRAIAGASAVRKGVGKNTEVIKKIDDEKPLQNRTDEAKTKKD